MGNDAYIGVDWARGSSATALEVWSLHADGSFARRAAFLIGNGDLFGLSLEEVLNCIDERHSRAIAEALDEAVAAMIQFRAEQLAEDPRMAGMTFAEIEANLRRNFDKKLREVLDETPQLAENEPPKS